MSTHSFTRKRKTMETGAEWINRLTDELKTVYLGLVKLAEDTTTLSIVDIIPEILPAVGLVLFAELQISEEDYADEQSGLCCKESISGHVSGPSQATAPYVRLASRKMALSRVHLVRLVIYLAKLLLKHLRGESPKVPDEDEWQLWKSFPLVSYREMNGRSFSTLFQALQHTAEYCTRLQRLVDALPGPFDNAMWLLRCELDDRLGFDLLDGDNLSSLHRTEYLFFGRLQNAVCWASFGTLDATFRERDGLFVCDHVVLEEADPPSGHGTGSYRYADATGQEEGMGLFDCDDVDIEEADPTSGHVTGSHRHPDSTVQEDGIGIPFECNDDTSEKVTASACGEEQDTRDDVILPMQCENDETGSASAAVNDHQYNHLEPVGMDQQAYGPAAFHPTSDVPPTITSLATLLAEVMAKFSPDAFAGLKYHEGTERPATWRVLDGKQLFICCCPQCEKNLRAGLYGRVRQFRCDGVPGEKAKYMDHNQPLPVKECPGRAKLRKHWKAQCPEDEWPWCLRYHKNNFPTEGRGKGCRCCAEASGLPGCVDEACETSGLNPTNVPVDAACETSCLNLTNVPVPPHPVQATGTNSRNLAIPASTSVVPRHLNPQTLRLHRAALGIMRDDSVEAWYEALFPKNVFQDEKVIQQRKAMNVFKKAYTALYSGLKDVKKKRRTNANEEIRHYFELRGRDFSLVPKILQLHLLLGLALDQLKYLSSNKAIWTHPEGHPEGDVGAIPVLFPGTPREPPEQPSERGQKAREAVTKLLLRYEDSYELLNPTVLDETRMFDHPLCRLPTAYEFLRMLVLTTNSTTWGDLAVVESIAVVA